MRKAMASTGTSGSGETDPNLVDTDGDTTTIAGFGVVDTAATPLLKPGDQVTCSIDPREIVLLGK